APDDIAGAQTGFFYDLIVHLDDYDTDTENNALLYVEQTLDKVLVLDRSGSMGNNGKIEAAQNAAALMVNELSDDDQGGYVAFDENDYLREALNGMDVGSHRQDMETAIANETPGGSTSIGDGMQRAAQEHDANGIADNACTFVLMSDGHENAEAYWDDVEAGVVDNGCALDVIGLGPQANEDLLQQIAGAGGGGGARASGASDGSYEYAPDTGMVSIHTPSGILPLGWQNNLSRIYDYKTTRAAGRQRITSDTRTSTGVEIYPFEVDVTTDELVVATAWQTGTVNADIRLVDPDGMQLPNTFSRLSTLGTNLVWRVPTPKPGSWMLSVRSLPQEVYVSASALTDLQLHLFTGANVPDAYPGMLVPILVSFVNLGQPALGAQVEALVTAPNGAQKVVKLYDDGAHGDTLPDDGVYGNYYMVTSLGEFVPADPTSYGDGAEPSSVGSYLVDAVGVWNGHRREAQGGFVLQEADDRDGDRLPTPYEEEHGLDPDDPNDATMDHDHDRLSTACEFKIGTHPLNPDTDLGGEIDGSEVPNCVPDVQDPHDPDDDNAGHFRGLIATPEATVDTPFIHLSLVGLTGGTFDTMDLYRRTYDGNGMLLQDWEMIADDHNQMTYMDRAIITGRIYNYRAIPAVMPPVRSVSYDSRTMESPMVLAQDDPYPPEGSIVIDEGAETTEDTLVTLSIVADDLSPEHGSLGTDPIPGSPSDELMMRLSNSDDFTGIAWQPYQPTVENWDLGALSPGDEATVYLQLMDAAGNVGASGLGMQDSIRLAGTTIYLPLVFRNH
ncbi:MAG: VWA domain-containing protein, partial [Anaerolineae bacterium]